MRTAAGTMMLKMVAVLRTANKGPKADGMVRYAEISTPL
jgi:hypothetical protein